MNDKQHPRCPVCDKMMVKWYEDVTLLSHPPQQRWHWWCPQDDIAIEGGMEREQTYEERLRDEWSRLNASD